MSVRIETSIKKYNKGYTQYETNIINQIFDTGDENSLKIKNLIIEDLEVEFADAATFSKQLSEVGGLDFDNYSLLSIFAKEKIESPTDMGLPVRFDVEIHPGSTITSSQFTIANCDGISWSDVTISNLRPNIDKKVLLTIVVGKI